MSDLSSLCVFRLTQLAGVCLVLAALALAAAGSGAAAAGGKIDSQVKVTATSGKIDKDGKQTITIKMQIKECWHAYANPVKNENFESNRTVVKIAAAKKLDNVTIDYPPGRKHVDGNFVFQIYEGTVEIKASFKRAPGDASPVDVAVKFVTCNDKSCLPPEEVKLEVK